MITKNDRHYRNTKRDLCYHVNWKTIVLFIVFTTTSMWKHMLEKGIERLTTAFLELKEESPFQEGEWEGHTVEGFVHSTALRVLSRDSQPQPGKATHYTSGSSQCFSPKDVHVLPQTAVAQLNLLGVLRRPRWEKPHYVQPLETNSSMGEKPSTTTIGKQGARLTSPQYQAILTPPSESSGAEST